MELTEQTEHRDVNFFTPASDETVISQINHLLSFQFFNILKLKVSKIKSDV